MFIGFDPSLASSGFVYLDSLGQVHSGTIRLDKVKGMERLDFIRQSLVEIIQSVKRNFGSVDLIGYEDYATSAKGKTFHIGELGGVLKYTAWEHGIDVLLVPPANLKQYATGRGTTRGKNKVEKSDIIAAVADEWGYNIQKDDEADAFVLYQMAKDYRVPRTRVRKKHRRDALAKCLLIKGKA